MPNGIVDGNGGLGPHTIFRVHRVTSGPHGCVRLQSENDGFYICVDHTGIPRASTVLEQGTILMLHPHGDRMLISFGATAAKGNLGIKDGHVKPAMNTGNGPHGSFRIHLA